MLMRFRRRTGRDRRHHAAYRAGWRPFGTIQHVVAAVQPVEGCAGELRRQTVAMAKALK